jgi:bifunctional DNA primase/polymerase-like protein/uncharacterized protein DUF5906/primase-like protein
MHAPPPLIEIPAANLAVARNLAAAGIAVFPALVFWDSQTGKWKKKPLVKHWQKAATTDRKQIETWWKMYPGAVPGIELGRAGLIVIDADRHGGPDGVAALDALTMEHNGLPVGPVTNTAGGGKHHIFRQPNGETFGNRKGALPDGIDVRGNGGWVVAPGSVRPDGGMWFAAVGTLSLADAFQAGTIPALPNWIAVLIREKGSQHQSGSFAKTDRSTKSDSPLAWSEAEAARIVSALRCIPADDRDNNWLRVGMALHWTRWGDRARALWDRWSKSSTKYDPAEQDKAWNSFGRPDYKGPLVTLGTLFDLAKKNGWEEGTISEIAELNRRYFLIRNVGGKCLIGELVPNLIGSGQMLSLQRVNDFKTWHSNRKITVRDGKGNKKKKPLGAVWLEHPKRRQYEGVDLVPDAPCDLPNGNLNLWRGFGIEAKKGGWPLLLRHICEVLAAGDRKAAEYILWWTAWGLQHPGERAEVALVLRGGKGSGKGVFGNAVAKCFGEHALHIFQQSHLTGNFNGHLRSCLFLFVDEAFWAGDKKGEGVLKGLITERTLVIEQKGIDAIQWPNRLHVLMVANADWVVPASHDERRFAVFDVSNKYAQGEAPEDVRVAYFRALHHELENGGLEAMLYDLRRLDLGNWHPRQVYETEGLRRQKHQSLSLLEQWLFELLQEGRLPTGTFWSEDRCEFAPTRDLVNDAKKRVPRLRDLSDKAMGEFLKKWGCVPDRTNVARGWQFPLLAKMRAEWNRRYGACEWDGPELEDWK